MIYQSVLGNNGDQIHVLVTFRWADDEAATIGEGEMRGV